jgi:aerotaxis receptor
MPEQAFADMWRTLKAGIPWTGSVKNRRRNGDHYWVHASVTPVQRDGRILGYVSVRTEPTRHEVAGAEALYRRIGAGSSALGIERGVVVRKGWLRWLSLARTASLRARCAAALLCALAPAALASFALGLPLGATAALAIALCVGGLVGQAIAENQILGPLQRVTQHAQIAAGGQSQTLPELKRTDAIGMLLRAINQMSVNQATIISDVKARIDGLHQACQEIAQGNMDLSGRTEQQASNLEETAASMEQMAAAVQATSEASGRANELAGKATETAQRGGEVVGQVTARMEEITTSSHRIADIIAVIDGIAFQTNILALNAAVEAARAGEQGRGFAVVASEVRTLAQRSADAAKEIKSLIGNSVESVRAGSTAVHSAGTTMQEIVHQVQQVATLIGEIATSIHEQTAGIGQVNQAVSHTDQVTQQNAALVEQTAAASTSLYQQAEELRIAVSSFEFS